MSTALHDVYGDRSRYSWCKNDSIYVINNVRYISDITANRKR